MLLNKESLTGISLQAAGLVALIDLSAIQQRTALVGSASLLDVLFLAPGMHAQQEASNVNGGELPMTAAMTTGYVFRVENQATVSYLQRIGEPGALVTIQVDSPSITSSAHVLSRICTGGIIPFMLYLAGVACTVVSIVLVSIINDKWALGILCMFIAARVLNTVIILRRTQMGWKGIPEPGVQGDLLVLLSQDRWVRIQGLVDDLKAVTSGQWLREQTRVEGFLSAFATVIVYCAAVFVPNASTVGSLIIAALLLVSVALLGLCNAFTKDFSMFGRRIYVSHEAKRYVRRLEMANELVESSGRQDWAVSMGLILGSAKVTV